MVSFDWHDAPPHIVRRIALMPLESTIDLREHAERIESELARYRQASSARCSSWPQGMSRPPGTSPQDEGRGAD